MSEKTSRQATPVTIPAPLVNTTGALPAASPAATMPAMDRKNPISREQIVAAFLFIALAGFVYLVAELLIPYATPVAWAVVLAVVFAPANRLLRRALPRWPNLSAGIMTLLVFSMVVVPSLLLTSVLAREAVEGYQHLARFLTSEHFSHIDRLKDHWMVAPLWQWLEQHQASGELEPTAILLSVTKWATQWLATQATAIAKNVVSFIVGLGIMLFSLFFAFRDGHRLLASFAEILPMQPADRERLITRLQQTIVAVVQGLTITAAIQALLLGLGLWLVGVPFAILLSTLAFFLAFLPVGGAAIVWVPTVVGLLVAGEVGHALILAAYCAAIVGSVDNLVRPIVIGSQASLSTPVLFFGILGGLQTYGFIGLFLGPAILATFSVLIRIYRERYAMPEMPPPHSLEPPSPAAP
ncbi:MAG: AI-2E family transporter [Candidatus Dadabacteria bacterium]|nr:MAG: AI-2E family transporter [Candidatus Dadabacteria bacterium]